MSGRWSLPEGSVTQARRGRDSERLEKRSPIQSPEACKQLEGTEKADLMKSLISRGHALRKLRASTRVMTGCPGKALGGFKPVPTPAAVAEQTVS